jgi:hypothetical protein
MHALCHTRHTSKTLKRGKGGAFGVYDVDPEGYILPCRNLPDDRKMGVSREKSAERFRTWAEANFCSSVNVFETFDHVSAEKKEGE